MKGTLLLFGVPTVCVLTVLAGCASSTRLTTVWSDPVTQPQSLRNLMVINVAKNPTVRRVFEDRFAARLKAQGIDAVPSYRLVGDAGLDSARADMEIHKNHCDGVLVTRVLDQKTVRTYYPPSSAYRPRSSYYRGWYNYYSLGYGYITTPGYTVERQLVHMETNLYRVSDGLLAWSALSRTWLQRSDAPGDEVDPIVRQLVQALSKESVVVRDTDR